MDVKVGDKVRIVRNTKCHTFPIGSEVTVVRILDEEVAAVGGNGIGQYITGDYEPVEDKTLELIANLSAEVARLSKRIESLESASKTNASVVINVLRGEGIE